MTYHPVDLIEVHAWGQLVGAVALDPSQGYFAFGYDAEWERRGVELAPFHLPIGRGPFVFPQLAEATFYRLPGMVADALPDRFGNALINARLIEEGMPINQITALDRLAYSADRGMGALEFRPPAPVAPLATAIQLADLVTAARASLQGTVATDDPNHDALNQLIQVGTSAGGARAKAVVCFNSNTGQIRSGHLPPAAGFGQWLLKLDGVEDSSLGPTGGYGRIEYAYHLMAVAAGITMTECQLLEEYGRAHFMTRRYDRLENGTKLHAQTLCGLDHLDFNSAGTHSYAQYLDAIDRLGLGPEAREEAFRRIVFNVAAVNRDDHTKNLSFLCSADGVWSLAPAYDLSHAHNPIGEWTQRHQMSVQGKLEGITRSELLILAERFTVPAPKRVIKEVGQAIAAWPDFARRAAVSDHDRTRVATDLATLGL